MSTPDDKQEATYDAYSKADFDVPTFIDYAEGRYSEPQPRDIETAVFYLNLAVGRLKAERTRLTFSAQTDWIAEALMLVITLLILLTRLIEKAEAGDASGN